MDRVQKACALSDGLKEHCLVSSSLESVPAPARVQTRTRYFKRK